MEGRLSKKWLVVVVGALAASLCTGCSATLPGVATLPKPAREFSFDIDLDGEPLTLHLAQPVTAATTPLVVYGSGDGGWFGTAVGMFRAIARGGHPTAGFSTRALMSIEHHRHRTLTVTQLVEGYRTVIAAARARLGLSAGTPVVLTGWSRGAALAVLVATSPEPRADVTGVVAIGLPAREDLELVADTDDAPPDGASGAFPLVRARAFELYPLLRGMGPRRVVIQASHDGYLKAADARRLFGADAADARLVDIDARNHRFDGAERELAVALVNAVNWVAAREDDVQSNWLHDALQDDNAGDTAHYRDCLRDHRLQELSAVRSRSRAFVSPAP